MAIKQLGASPSGSSDADTKGARDTAISAALAAADGTGLTESGGVLSVGVQYRSIPIPFHLTSTQTTGVKLPEFIAPVAMTVVACYARANSGSGSAVRPSKNGGTGDGTILSSIGTSAVNNAQSVSLAAGDRLGINVTTAGTGSDISVTFWANIT